MKILEKFVLIIYSFLILIISAVLCLLVFNIIDIETFNIWIDYITKNQSGAIITLGTSIICILLSVRCIFFRKRKEIKKSNATDILLENDSGRLLISKGAIENAVKNIINDTLSSAPESKIVVDIDPATNISTYISIVLDDEIKVRDFTVGLQMKIKEKIKENFDLDVKQVNIKIDSSPKENKNDKDNTNSTKDNESKNEENIIEVEKSTV